MSNKTTALVTTDGTIVRKWRYPSPEVNPARVYLASLAPGSQRTMTAALEAIASLAAPRGDIDTLPWHLLRFQHTQAVRAQLAEAYDYQTCNKYLSALRGTLKAAWRLGLMTADEYMAAADVANVKGSKPDQSAGKAVGSGDVFALVDACNDGTLAGVRDTAMLGVAVAGGLRRAEIVALDVANVNQAGGVLTVKGKRNKTRTVPLPDGALAAVRDWLDVRGASAGPLFVRIGKGDKVSDERLSTQAVYSIFKNRAEQARVGTFSPHDLRRTFAGDMLDAGVDISTVQKMMGHANVSTTAGYDRRGERVKRDAAKRIFFPYSGKGGR
jgi:site-specific recombinase XerD